MHRRRRPALLTPRYFGLCPLNARNARKARNGPRSLPRFGSSRPARALRRRRDSDAVGGPVWQGSCGLAAGSGGDTEGALESRPSNGEVRSRDGNLGVSTHRSNGRDPGTALQVRGPAPTTVRGASKCALVTMTYRLPRAESAGPLETVDLFCQRGSTSTHTSTSSCQPPQLGAAYPNGCERAPCSDAPTTQGTPTGPPDGQSGGGCPIRARSDQRVIAAANCRLRRSVRTWPVVRDTSRSRMN